MVIEQQLDVIHRGQDVGASLPVRDDNKLHLGEDGGYELQNVTPTHGVDVIKTPTILPPSLPSILWVHKDYLS